MKKVLTLVSILLAVGFASQSYAACSQYGKVTRVYSNASGTADYSYFYFTPRTTNAYTTYAYYVYAGSADSQAAATLLAASNSGDTVLVNGSAATCPTTGTNRYVGIVNYAYKFNNL